MNIGVAIVTYNNSKDIQKCLQGVLNAGIKDISIVDNCSSDDTVLKIRDAGFLCTELDSNRGFGYGANIAARTLNTKYILFLNPDSLLSPEALKNVESTIEQYPEAAIIGMLLCNEKNEPEFMAHGDEPRLSRLLVRRMKNRMVPSAPFPVDWVSGGALVMRADIFRSVGGYDEKFFLYWEDVDLCRRVRNKGHVILMDPVARVIHRRGGSGLHEVLKKRIYDESADRYFKKHYPTYIWKTQRILRRLYRLL